MCVNDAEGICFNCAGAVAEDKKKGGGTLLLQDQLPKDHPGRQLPAKETTWCFVKRQHNDEPSRWSDESAGVICHENQVLEVYQLDIENKVQESDHVKTNDETIKPENLKKEDKNELKEAIYSSLRSPIARTSWLAVMLASAVAIGTTSSPGNKMMLDATVWNFQQREDRRAARKLLNNKMPRCILANGVEENDYALELAKWQYRTGTGFLLTTKNKDDKLRKLVELPGVIAISFGKQWTYGSKLGPNRMTTLVTNVKEVAKSIYKSLKRAELEMKSTSRRMKPAQYCGRSRRDTRKS